MSTLWNDPLILFDLGSSGTSTNNYPIKIDLNNGFALKSVYYFARSRG